MEDGSFEGLVDPLLEGIYDKQQMACMVACAAFSIRHSAKRCPKMSQFRKLDSSSEFGATSEYGLKPSIPISEQSSAEYASAMRV
ncbi:hypothetical protein VNO80_01095 [Phaseolus coccineus]|uniref:Uncharacterized protein n=1 Tax=Phaseolus coccineus TaxID=3886 RepID=A0AAN9RSI3_PHACN